MNVPARLSRALALLLCAALASAGLPAEALARVVARVPVQSPPVGVSASAARAVGNFSAARSPAASSPFSLAISVGGPAPGITQSLGASALPAGAPAPRATSPAEEPSTADEFKADARAASVADVPAVAAGFAALQRHFTTRAPVSFSAPDEGKNFLHAPLAPAPLASFARPASDDGGQGAPSAPPASSGGPSDDGGGKGGLALGKAAIAFIGALLIAQIGVEALGNAMPVVAQRQFNSSTVVAQLAIFSSIAGIIGRQFGPLIIDRLGLRKAYLITEVARAVSISILIGLLLTGHMTIPLMMAFSSLNGLLGGVAATAEASIPPALIGQNQAKLEKFWTWEQTLLEVVGALGPIAAGFAIDNYGAGPTLAAFPVSFMAAFFILFLVLRLPDKGAALRRAELQKNDAPRESPGQSVLGAFLRKITRGAKLVWASPPLRYSFLAYTAFMLLNPFLYSLIGPAFSFLIAGADGMGGVLGLLTGLYSAGGLLGGLLLIREQRRIKKAKSSGAMTDAQETEHLRRSMKKWMLWTIPSLAAFATMAVNLPMLSALVALPGWLAWAGPLTLPAVALIPFGVAQVISMVKLRSYFQAKVPAPQDMADAMGFLGSASLAASTLGLFGLTFLFEHSSGTLPFIIIAAAMVPVGAYYYYITRKLDAAAAPPRGQ